MELRCSICNVRFDTDESNRAHEKIFCAVCEYPLIGNRLIRVFGFYEYEDAAEAFELPASIFDKLNTKPGRNLESLTYVIIAFARALPLDMRRKILEMKPLRQDLSNRCLELLAVRNLSYLSILLRMSPSILSNLNKGTAGKPVTKFMTIAVNLAEHLPPSQRVKYARGRKISI